jgi:hypothetical protein
VILLISASQVARITGVSHWRLPGLPIFKVPPGYEVEGYTGEKDCTRHLRHSEEILDILMAP